MATTISLVFAGANTLRYLIVITGGGSKFLIDNTGAASPDIRTDAPAGPIRQMALVQDDGYGIIPAGAIIGAQARALFMADNPDGSIAGVGAVLARCTLTPISGSATWTVDVDSFGGNPVIGGESSAAGSAYLELSVIGAIGA